MSQENVAKIPEEVITSLANFVLGALPSDDVDYIRAEAVLRVLSGIDSEYTEKEQTPVEYVTLTDEELRAEKEALRQEIYKQMDSKWPVKKVDNKVVPVDEIMEDFLTTLRNLS